MITTFTILSKRPSIQNVGGMEPLTYLGFGQGRGGIRETKIQIKRI